jgi:hypothetical protein
MFSIWKSRVCHAISSKGWTWTIIARKRPLYRFPKREGVLQRLCKMFHVFVLTNRSILFQRQTNLVLSVIVFNLHFYISAHLFLYTCIVELVPVGRKIDNTQSTLYKYNLCIILQTICITLVMLLNLKHFELA